MSKLDSFLAHYASEFYDPVKAHEYYMRTRQLKGRSESTKGMSKTQKEAWGYAKTQIAAKRQADIKNAQVTRTKSSQQVREQAQQLRKALTEKLRAFNESLNTRLSSETSKISEDAAKKRQDIVDRVSAEIAALPQVPKNIPDTKRKRFLAERADKVAAIQGKANEELASISASSSDAVAKSKTAARNEKITNQNSIASERTRVATDLKAAITKFSEAYNAAKTNASRTYDANRATEFKNIKTKVR